MPRLVLALCAALGLLASAWAQPPMLKVPALPPINPAQARPDQTIGGLDGPGLALAANDELGLLAAAGDGRSIHYWHKDVKLGVRTGDTAGHVLPGHEALVLGLAWGGKTLASAGAEGKVHLWDMPDGKLRTTLAVGTTVRALAASLDGKLLVTGGDDGAAVLWDLATGKQAAKLDAHADWVRALAFSPDGKFLASGGQDGVVRIWEVPGGKKVADVAKLPPPQGTPANAPPTPAAVVLALAFSPDGKALAVGTSDGPIHLLNPADGKPVRAIPGHTGAVTSLVFHPSGTLLVSGSKDRTVRLWNPQNGQAYKSLEGHTAWVQGVTLFGQGTRLASAGADGTVRLWDLSDPTKK